MSDDLESDERYRLTSEGGYGEPGVIESEYEGATTPCPHCGFRNYLGMLVSSGSCVECKAEVSVCVEYGEPQGDYDEW